MDFKFSKPQLMMQKMIREFAEKEVAPVAAENDELARFPIDIVDKMRDLGLLGMIVPREYGGSGCDTLTYITAVEELCKTCASTGGIIAAVNSLYCWPIVQFGTEEQKHKYLTPISKGKALGAFGLTEPEAGSDAINQQTTAVDEGDYFRLNGTKCFISGGDVADYMVVFAKLVKPGRKRGLVNAFIIEKTMPGFSVGTRENKLGIRASGTAELVFQDMMIPKENLLGPLNKGFVVAMDTLDGGRISIAAQAVGIAQGAMEAALKYSQERKQFGKAIFNFQAIQFMLADMATRISAARLLVQKAALEKDGGRPISMSSAQAKLFASETANWVTDKALQIHGGYGYIKDYPVERYFRDARITEIYEGTSEIQRLVIATNLLRKGAQ